MGKKRARHAFDSLERSQLLMTPGCPWRLTHTLILLPLSAGLISSSGSYLMCTNHVSNWSMGWETWWSGVGARWNISIGPLKNPSVCFSLSAPHLHVWPMFGALYWRFKNKPSYGCLFVTMSLMDAAFFFSHGTLYQVCKMFVQAESKVSLFLGRVSIFTLMGKSGL